jgi:Lrp/AsnC family transcriptional regulator, regulator for asnA, asnC and gidA
LLAKLTRLDQAIIQRLNQNARLTSSEIARALQVAERTVRHRMNRLITAGVINPVAVVNPAAFGYTLVVDIFCEVDVAAQIEITEAIAALPEVSYLAYFTGDQDISFQALFKNSEEMHYFITNRLHQIPGIRRTRTVLVPRIVKDTYQWLPPDEEFTE